MPLATLSDVLKIAEKTGTAIPAFNIDNIEGTEAIMDAAEAEKSPVILTVGQGAIKAGQLWHLADLVKRLAAETTLPVVLHLDHGISYEQTAVGDKYVAENMMENNYSLGGEQSGHIIFSRYAATGDGILTSLMIMEACVEKKATLCDLAKEMKVYPQLLRNVRVSDKKTARENPAVVKAIEEVAISLGNEGRILVRESGTEPLIRVMVEAGTDELCHENVDRVVKVMEAEGLVID